MKLRIKGNSLRLRVTRSELSRLIQSGRIEDTIQFAPEKDSSLTYALECSTAQREASVRYRPHEVTVAIPFEDARLWISSDQVGISHELRVGDWALAILLEKDFACLNGANAEGEDTFPNPKTDLVC